MKMSWIDYFLVSFINFSVFGPCLVIVPNWRSSLHSIGNRNIHKRTAWGCKGCGRIPNPEKLAIIWAKIFKIWAKYTATFTCNAVVSIFQTEAK